MRRYQSGEMPAERADITAIRLAWYAAGRNSDDEFLRAFVIVSNEPVDGPSGRISRKPGEEAHSSAVLTQLYSVKFEYYERHFTTLSNFSIRG